MLYLKKNNCLYDNLFLFENLKYISVNEDMTITVDHTVSKLKIFLLIFKLI